MEEDTIETFMSNFDRDYPDEDTWSWNKLDEEISGCEDARFEEMKDERMERENENN